ncbi:hypothetical protein DFJ74DRAFT_710202 [Hyaloraphidium curvatum]|nr:hypothetical protein DFJ74DRAFT_710202 [Hyaloraphidium curvatum]
MSPPLDKLLGPDSLDPSLKVAAEIYIRSRPVFASVWFRMLFRDATGIFLFLLVFPFNDGMFRTRGLAVATVAFVLDTAWWTWVAHGSMQWFGVFEDRSPKHHKPAEAPPELDNAFSELQSNRKRPTRPVSSSTVTLEHDPEDEDLYPCVDCTRSVLRSASLSMTFTVVLSTLCGVVIWLLLRNWTSIVTLANGATTSGSIGLFFRSIFLGDFAAILVNAAGASCVPASYVASIGLLLYLATLSMFNTAWVNRQCDPTARVYRGAVLELTAMADEAATAPPAVLS